MLGGCIASGEDEVRQWISEERAQARPRVTPIAEPKQFKPETYTQVTAVEPFSNQKLTAAHNTLPLGTYVRVTNLRNGRTVTVKINDRLHHRNKRIIDLSRAGATKLGFIKSGLTRVKIEVLGKKPPSK